MKKLAAAVIGAAGVVALAFGITGTFAAFSATEETPVLMEAGTLDLVLTDENDQLTEPIEFTDMQPSAAPSPGTYEESEHHYFLKLTNGGDVTAEASWRFQGSQEFENGCVAPEIAAGDTSCGHPGEGHGELGNQLRVNFSAAPEGMDDCGGTPGVVAPRQFVPTTDIGYQSIRPVVGGVVQPTLVLDPGATRCVKVDIYFLDLPENNIAQGDSSVFHLGFRLVQV